MQQTPPDKIVIHIGPKSQGKTTSLPIIPRELALVKQSDPVLHTPCEPAMVGMLYRTQNESLIECMLKVCEAKNGYGLSACQLGISTRLFVIYMVYGMADKDFAFFNPEILERSTETSIMEEGCLSLPYIVHRVERPNCVILKYQDINGMWKQETYHGITARVICHEMDHLDGKTLFDHMSPLESRRARERQAKRFKKDARQH